MNAPNKKSILIVSFIGYVTQELPVETAKPMSIILKEDTKTLDEVVIVGYQEVKKKDLTGAVAKVNMEDLLKTPASSFDQTLGGRIAGVNVSSGEGMPGGTMNIVIRGNNSLTQDNSPLYVIDGFPVEDPAIAATINPSDAESVEVLKDASATAIYGAVVLTVSLLSRPRKERLENLNSSMTEVSDFSRSPIQFQCWMRMSL